MGLRAIPGEDGRAVVSSLVQTPIRSGTSMRRARMAEKFPMHLICEGESGARIVVSCRVGLPNDAADFAVHRDGLARLCSVEAVTRFCSANREGKSVLKPRGGCA
jgi:hypothetical protein